MAAEIAGAEESFGIAGVDLLHRLGLGERVDMVGGQTAQGDGGSTEVAERDDRGRDCRHGGRRDKVSLGRWGAFQAHFHQRPS